MPAPRDPLAPFRDEVVSAIRSALATLGWEEAATAVPDVLEVPDEDHGDLAYPCFSLAQVARRAPAEIAQMVGDALPEMERAVATVAGPYVNLRFDREVLVREVLGAVEAHGAAYGDLEPTGESVIVEHTSANPNGPFHVGRARNPVVGDSLVRVLRAAGLDVTAEYYVNDMGKQVAILAWGLANLDASDVPKVDRGKVDHERVVYYQRANELLEGDPEVEREVNALIERFESGDEEAGARFREAAEGVLEGMRASLRRMNVAMDSYAWESTFVLGGDVEEVVTGLKGLDIAHREEDEAWYLDLEEFGIQGRTARWFFTRSDGTTLYTTRDLAYHMDKFRRADRAVNILGEDHKLTMQQLGIGLDLLGETHDVEVVWISFVNLPEGKMSTRRGRVVYLDDLLDEAVARAYEEVETRRGEELSQEAMERIAEVVGIGAVRFNIARVQPEKGITFRWEEALNFEGSSAPFCQYAHARCAGILRRAREEGVAMDEPADLALLTHPSEVALVRALAQLPGVVGTCAAELKVHPVPEYAVEVANRLNDLYRDCPVLQAEPDLRAARLALVRATRAVLGRALELVGVEAPDSM